jgi:AcrR family transcriptional regulator
VSLREQKKLQTRQAIFLVALEMFREHGFDKVTVAEIAERAGISKMTIFNYFPTKEEIVLGPMEEHTGDPAAIVAGRAPGESIVAAFRRTFLQRLAERAAETGLNDSPVLVQVINLVKESPPMTARVFQFQLRGEQLLVAALTGREPGPHDIREPVSPEVIEAMRGQGPDDLVARIAAGQIMSLWRALQSENFRLILGGMSADAAYPHAVDAANQGFDLLEKGLGRYGASARP